MRSHRRMSSAMRRTCRRAIAVAVLCLGSLSGRAVAQGGGELRFCLRMEPKTFDPLKVEDEASAAIRYLTGGVLLRVNRQTQELEPELAKSWKVSKDGLSTVKGERLSDLGVMIKAWDGPKPKEEELVKMLDQ